MPYVTDMGFRHATREEVMELFLNAGAAAAPGHNYGNANRPAISTVMSFLGRTDPSYTNTSGISTYGANQIIVTKAVYGSGTIESYWSSPTYMNFDSTNPVTGHFLVRPIPEPTTMLLLGAGLLGFAGARRRMKR